MRLLSLTALVLLLSSLGCSSNDDNASLPNEDRPRLEFTEIHYHPTEGPYEFIEVTNRENSDINLSGWRISGDVEFTFPQSYSLSKGTSLTIAENSSALSDRFDVTAAGEYIGKLNNAGGSLFLIDSKNEVIDLVNYDDGSRQDKSILTDGVIGEWPVSADGEGFSLQLMSDTLDNRRSSSWTAFLPTPAEQTNLQTLPPRAEQLSWTHLPDESENIDVEAACVRCVSPHLEILIGYPGNPIEPIPLTQVGSIWTATLDSSHYNQGQLVRMKIIDGEHNVAPLSDDSRKWFGTTIQSPTMSDIPKIEWFVDDNDFEEILSKPQEDIVKTCVIAHDGDIWDQSTYKLRGNYSRSQNKKSFKIRLPEHHKIDIDEFPNPVDNFDLASPAADESKIRQVLAHQLAGDMGVVNVKATHTEVHKNANFYALYTLQEHPDSDFRKRYHLTNSSFYDTGTDPIAYNLPETTRRETENELLAGPDGFLPADVNFDDWNIPSWVNMMAASSIIGHSDFRMGNFYMWIDHNKGSRAEGMLWDMDLTLGRTVQPDQNGGAMVIVFEDPNIWTGWRRWKVQVSEPAYLKPAVTIPVFRQMYLRRVRTLANEYLASGKIAQDAQTLFTRIQPLWNIDNSLFPQFRNNNFSETESIDKLTQEYIIGLLAHIDGGGPDGDLPGQQPPEPNIKIEGPINLGTVSEHYLIKNLENVAIDLSGVKLSGEIDFEFPPGAVLPAGFDGHVVQNDAVDGFRSAYVNQYVLGTYAKGNANTLTITWPTID